MTLQEKYAYRKAMQEMADDCMTMFNHYQDEVKRMDEEITEEYAKRTKNIDWSTVVWHDKYGEIK